MYTRPKTVTHLVTVPEDRARREGGLGAVPKRGEGDRAPRLCPREGILTAPSPPLPYGYATAPIPVTHLTHCRICRKPVRSEQGGRR